MTTFPPFFIQQFDHLPSMLNYHLSKLKSYKKIPNQFIKIKPIEFEFNGLKFI